MNLLKAVNTVLPHLGEHVIDRVHGAKHPTVDLILSAIERNKQSVLAEGLWFNELILTIPVNTDGQIDAPKDAIAIYGQDCNVELDGTRLVDLDTGSRYFTRPVTVKIMRDVDFEKLPVNVALYLTYSAGSEVYLQDYGVEGSVQELQRLANRSWVLVTQENLRKRKYNSQKKTGHRYRNAIRFR